MPCIFNNRFRHTRQHNPEPMQQLISIKDISQPESLLGQALWLKQQPGRLSGMGQGKTLGLLFFNPSLRTRLSTQKAAASLGMQCMVMNVGSEGWQIETEEGVVMDGDKQEHIQEAAAVMSQYCDIIGVRTFARFQCREQDYRDECINGFARYASVPVISLESATGHPLQGLADMMTIYRNRTTDKPKIVLSWAPHPKRLPQAVPNSFVEWATALGWPVTICNPPGFDLAPHITRNANVLHNQEQALEDADFVYAKNWSSYESYGQVGTQYSDWTISPEKMAGTNNAGFMHCLPVRRNVVVDEQVLTSPRSLVLDQANNRTFAAQAVLARILLHQMNPQQHDFHNPEQQCA